MFIKKEQKQVTEKEKKCLETLGIIKKGPAGKRKHQTL